MGANAELVLRVRDAGASAGLKAVEKQAETSAAKSAAATEASAWRSVRAVQAQHEQTIKLNSNLAFARERLGIRSEQVVRDEISKTRQAYQLLASSGTLSAREMGRAYDAQKQKIRELRNEMGELTKSQKALAALPVVAGIGAAAYTLKAPAQAAMSFDERLAGMANTAFADSDIAGRRAGMKQLESAINKAVGKGGGGTRDQAAETLDMLIASGAMSSRNAMDMLPQLMKASTASGASAVELAQIGIRAQQTFRIKPEEMSNVLNMALSAGQAGGFELKDMAKWLPQQMAAATMSGMSGRAGFAKLAALNQASAITAGTKDEAGNNVVNLLAKINSSDTANDAKKLGINLPAYLQAQRNKGLDSVDAFAALVDRTVSKRADYQVLKKQLASAKTGEDKRAALESMATIAQGAGIGKLVQDRQAMMALLGLMNNRQYMDDVLKKVQANDVSSGGAIDNNYALMSETSSFKVRQAEQAKDAAQKSAMDGLTPAIGKAAEAFSDLAIKHPLLAGATTLATTAVTAFAAAAGLTAVGLGGKLPGIGKVLGGGRAAAGAVAGLASAPLAVGAASLGAGYAMGNTEPVGKLVLNVMSLFGSKDAQMALDTMKADEKPKMDANLTVGLAPGLVLQSQKMEAKGPVNAWMTTGSVWGTP